VLPVEFDRAAEILLEEVRGFSPQIVISFGQAEGRAAITPEKIAINLDSARIPDNAGDQRQNQVIREYGADGYFSTLPVEEMVAALKDAGVAGSLSLSAGSFVCNHIFYALQHELKGMNIKSGFIHLPLVPEQSSEFPNQPTMSLDELVKGAKEIIASCLNAG
jgi:pyroglutamyl-peptidase